MRQLRRPALAQTKRTEKLKFRARPSAEAWTFDPRYYTSLWRPLDRRLDMAEGSPVPVCGPWCVACSLRPGSPVLLLRPGC